MRKKDEGKYEGYTDNILLQCEYDLRKIMREKDEKIRGKMKRKDKRKDKGKKMKVIQTTCSPSMCI